MTTIGDVLMVFGGLLALAGTVWATIVLAALLFQSRAATAARELEDHPARAWWTGLLVVGFGVLVSLVLLSMPLPLMKLAGFVALAMVVSLAILGCGGLTKLVARQVKGAGGPSEAFAGYLRGAALLVGACSIPLVGWLVFAPVVLVLGAGAGVRSFVRSRAPEPFGAEA